MTRQSIHARVNTLTDTASFESSEDTYFVQYNGHQLTIMVADGARQRLKTNGSLLPLYHHYKNVSTPGQYAACLTRDTIAEQIAMHPQRPIREIPLLANHRLKESLESIYGEISASAVLKHEPTLHSQLKDDPRLVRLILPVCCFTVASIDLESATLSYAHGGDTALFAMYKDGNTVQITPDQVVQHDDVVNRERSRIIQELQPQDEAEYLKLTADAQLINQNNGIYHNYVDKNGNTDTKLGIGVINGLPQLEAYLVTGTISLDNIKQIILTSDGMLWPGAFDETIDQAKERVNRMGHLFRQHGIHGYLQHLHQHIANPDSPDYRPFGKVDDATAIQVQITKK